MKSGETRTTEHTNRFRMVMRGPARCPVTGVAWGAADEMKR